MIGVVEFLLLLLFFAQIRLHPNRPITTVKENSLSSISLQIFFSFLPEFPHQVLNLTISFLFSLSSTLSSKITSTEYFPRFLCNRIFPHLVSWLHLAERLLQSDVGS